MFGIPNIQIKSSLQINFIHKIDVWAKTPKKSNILSWNIFVPSKPRWACFSITTQNSSLKFPESLKFKIWVKKLQNWENTTANTKSKHTHIHYDPELIPGRRTLFVPCRSGGLHEATTSTRASTTSHHNPGING